MSKENTMGTLKRVVLKRREKPGLECAAKSLGIDDRLIARGGRPGGGEAFNSGFGIFLCERGYRKPQNQPPRCAALPTR